MRTLALVVLCLVVVPAGVFAWATSSRSGGDWTVPAAKAAMQALGYSRVRVLPVPGRAQTPAVIRPLLASIRGIVTAQQFGGAAIVIVMRDARSAHRIEDAQRTAARRSHFGLAVVANVLIEAIPVRDLQKVVAGFRR